MVSSLDSNNPGKESGIDDGHRNTPSARHSSIMEFASTTVNIYVFSLYFKNLDKPPTLSVVFDGVERNLENCSAFSDIHFY